MVQPIEKSSSDAVEFRYIEHLQQGLDMSVDIGSRLRHLRMAHNLSQRELARRAGVTKSTISLI